MDNIILITRGLMKYYLIFVMVNIIIIRILNFLILLYYSLLFNHIKYFFNYYKIVLKQLSIF